MTSATQHEDDPRHEGLEELVRIEGRASEAAKAAEAAAAAAAHAVEATKAAEAASAARVAQEAKAASTETAINAPPPSVQSDAGQDLTHVLELRLDDDELAQIVQLAAERDLLVPDLARSLIMEAIGRSDDN